MKITEDSYIFLSLDGRFIFFHRLIRRCPPPPNCLADPSAVEKAVKVLSEARKPLVIIGKGKEIKECFFMLPPCKRHGGKRPLCVPVVYFALAVPQQYYEVCLFTVVLIPFFRCSLCSC